ncbi:MAG: hypothetical protein A2021_04405 [Elusimicrobia bacterium GWF2_52_66]|nr:MAG: hypothetical protein A2X33_02735 [Elusimicrobia bacterium GWA2_51_34]OGR84435.1 MAG: hypothetical protein A2021_04405 [Elusimicrobia bacterium GWF2_52_66]HAF95545.1 hypothetical protein [Elusimicrobiota bacterium]HCE97711.1 hypothetical protein [Elusimicrobiota bacterium]
MIIQKGTILIYRVFDVGGEILLSEAEKILSQSSPGFRLKLATDTRKAIIIKDSPLKADLGEDTLKLPGGEFKVSARARLWNYGAISITLELDIPAGCGWEELVKLAADIEASEKIEEMARRHNSNIKKKILPAIKNPAEWEVFEDYITYIIEKADGLDNPAEFIKKVDVAALIMAEDEECLSEESKAFITENAMQYAKTDLAVIDWNSALLIEPDGQRDVADVIEFSLTHLLEFRYYDEMLNRNLDYLYDTIEEKRESIVNIFRNYYADIAEDSSRKYMEFSEFLGRVENSLKTVGDPYLAIIFKASAHEFHFDDWQKSISRKMETLAQITQILHGEVNTRRSHWLEIIIIALIALELVPLLLDLLRYLR